MVTRLTWTAAVAAGLFLPAVLHGAAGATAPGAPTEPALVIAPPAAAGNEDVFPTVERLLQPPPCAVVACAANPADPSCCRAGFIAYGDYLNWKASQTGLDYATVVNPVTLTPIATAELDLQRASGLRAGIGYRFPGTNCDLTWNYTHFQSDDQRSLVANGVTTTLLSTRSFFSAMPMNSVEADDSLKLNIHDFEVNWRSWLNDAVGFRAFGSVRWAMIDQDFNSNYTYLNAVQGVIHLPTDMDAEGLRLGSEFQWRSAWGFRVFGRGAASVLVADFKSQRQEMDSLHGVILDAPQQATRVVPVVEAAAGVAWSQGPWEVSAGYEMSDWFNMVPVGGVPSAVMGGVGNGPLPVTEQSLFIDGFFLRLTFVH
ncbi:MAG: Lpg1974 family pore-forming outer membrane protein [Thermoguttaceae bacterium]|jgi:hypothetical protein